MLGKIVLDAFTAYGVGVVAAVLVLLAFGLINTSMPADDVIGKIVLQAVLASFGALLARSQLGAGSAEEPSTGPGLKYAGELFTMTVGALFLAFNVAPTEEMILIAYKLEPWQGVLLMIVSILVMHAFVYATEFRGSPRVPPGSMIAKEFMAFTIPGYAIGLLVSAFILWVFGRTEGEGLNQLALATVVLGFPAAIGAASARLVL